MFRTIRLFLVILCAAWLVGQSLPSLAAPVPPTPSAPQTAPGQTISPEALFAAMLVDAEKGQPRAMLRVGTFYEQGTGVPRNFSKAFTWYAKAADAGSGEAWMRLGVCHEVGVGVTADAEKALAAFSKAASLAFAPAQYKLADMHLKGNGAAKDEARGFEFLAQAAEGGEPAAMYDMGQILRSGLFGRKADPERARQWFSKGAEAAHAGSILSLASMLKDGSGGKADLEGALRWYLIGQKAGMSGAPLDAAIRELRGKLAAGREKAAEKAAETWIAARTQKQAGRGRER